MANVNLGIVIRADGSVPFDPPVYGEDGEHIAGLHPIHKDAMIRHLVETGHEIEHAPCGTKVIVRSGPLVDGNG